jgi:hypothetical protein
LRNIGSSSFSIRAFDSILAKEICKLAVGNSQQVGRKLKLVARFVEVSERPTTITHLSLLVLQKSTYFDVVEHSRDSVQWGHMKFYYISDS